MNYNTNYRLGTRAVHAGQEPDPTTTARAVPIYATSSYVFKDTDHAADLFALREFGNIYSRMMNPTCDVLEKRLSALDGGIGALSFASGQAAITAAILTIVHAGQNFIASTSLYGGTWNLFTQTLKKLGVEVRFFEPSVPESINELVDDNTRCVYFESLGNPKNDIPDFKKLAEISHSHNLPLICDNTVMTPILLRPIEHGIDIVVYSTTKFLGGHGVHVGGAIVDSGNFDWNANPGKWPEFCAPDDAYHGMVFTEALKPLGNLAYIIHIRTNFLRDTGGCMSPFAAFLFLMGLETLHLRMQAHCENAAAVALFLHQHEAVEWVNHPSLRDHPSYSNGQKYLPDGQGAIIGFGIKGGRDAGIRFINSCRLASHLANIGDAKTLVIHPASTTHSQLTPAEQAASGITPEYVRLSIGIESLDDIIADFDQALQAAHQPFGTPPEPQC